MNSIRIELMNILREAEKIPDNYWHIALITEIIRKRTNNWISTEKVKIELEKMYVEGLIEKEGNEFIYIKRMTMKTTKRNIINMLKRNKNKKFLASEIAEKYNLNKSTIYKIIRQLEKEGLIEVIKKSPKVIKWKSNSKND